MTPALLHTLALMELPCALVATSVQSPFTTETLPLHVPQESTVALGLPPSPIARPAQLGSFVHLVPALLPFVLLAHFAPTLPLQSLAQLESIAPQQGLLTPLLV